MPSRGLTICASSLAILVVVFVLIPAEAQQIHRHGFGARQTAFIRGDANLRVEEKAHDISNQYFKSQPTSEHFQLVFDAATGDSPFVHFFYETPPAPVSAMLTASLWVRATKPGVQLRARVVFPKEPDPDRPEIPLTMLIVGKTSEKTRNWDKLSLENVPELVGKYLPNVRARIGRDVNTTDAFIDRLVLNMYTGPGPVEIWVDDLDIGPVRPSISVDEKTGNPGILGKQIKNPDLARLASRTPRKVEQRGGQLQVDQKPYFFRAIRHTGVPLYVLRQAGFETLWLPTDVSTNVLEETAREGWYIIPSTPIVNSESLVSTEIASEAAMYDNLVRKFGNSEVLFWDLGGERGGALTLEQSDRVQRSRNALHSRDREPKRPVGGDLWDGYETYSNYLDVVGAHRWPLFTSLDLVKYRDWLMQRRALTRDRPVFWTWIQNHQPEWHSAAVASATVNAAKAARVNEPMGPLPEQVRLLTYISLAVGCRGLGFWSDQSLSDAQLGRDRLQGMAILNAELDMLTPALLSIGVAGTRTQWLDTSHPYVKAAILTGQKGLVVLPIWLGPGDQLVPAQGSVNQLTMTIPGIADGYDPWLISPVGVDCIRHRMKRTSRGTELIIDEFDLVSPVVFTADLAPDGLVVWWQDRARRYGKSVAKWSLDLAAVEYEKVRAVHMKLTEMGVQLEGGNRLLEETKRYYDEANRDFHNELYSKAYNTATRSLRPLRVLMRAHWQMAVDTLDLPTASMFATSFFTLPLHWEMAREVQASKPSSNLLPHGDFEIVEEVPLAGIPIENLPGWSARTGSLELDQVAVAAGIVQTEKLADIPIPRGTPPKPKNWYTPSRPYVPPDEGYVPPAPKLGSGALKLEIRRPALRARDGTPIMNSKPLERTFLAVESPTVSAAPGSLVRISGWIKVPDPIQGTSDGVLLFDSVGGEPLGVRILNTIDNPNRPGGWKQYHLYRHVPASGRISVTVALTGLGIAYFDDIRIEPLVASAAAKSNSSPLPAKPGTVLPAGYR